MRFRPGLLLVTLAVVNRHEVRLVLDPFRPETPVLSLVLPFYAYLFITLLLGVLLGGTAMWLSQARWRRNARHHGGARPLACRSRPPDARARCHRRDSAPSSWRRPALKRAALFAQPAISATRCGRRTICHCDSVFKRTIPREQMTTEVKICGLRTQGALDAALAAGADYVGFVFYRAQPAQHRAGRGARCSPPARAAKPRSWRCWSIPDDALLAEVIDAVAPDILQLHGTETPARVAEIARASAVR